MRSSTTRTTRRIPRCSALSRLARGCILAGLVGASAMGGGCTRPPPAKLTLEQMIAADPLPLAKGATWTYQVTMTKYDPVADRDVTSEAEWVTEVVDVKRGNGVDAFVVKGWPSDLASFERGLAATETTLLRSGNNFLFAASPEPTLDGAEGWFWWPVTDGQRLCPRKDLTYCWQVTAVETGYELTYHTGLDEQTYQLQPGTGVARYFYAHHGTSSKIEAKLVDYDKGR